jgi:ferrous iron transport protein A
MAVLKLENANQVWEGGERMMPLTMAKAGETVMIRKITGKDEVRQHLAELGFVVDSDVTVVSEIAGNLIVQVKDSRIALDKTMANRIMV